MPSVKEILPPEDFLEGAARRAYEVYGQQHKGMGMNFPKWKHAVIGAKMNWRKIVMAALGVQGDVMQINRFNKNPFTLIITGFDQVGFETFKKALEDRLGGVTRITPIAAEGSQEDGDKLQSSDG